MRFGVSSRTISEFVSQIASNWKIVPNIVDVNTFKFAERDTPTGRMDLRWALYESKGVEKLLKSFAPLQQESLRQQSNVGR